MKQIHVHLAGAACALAACAAFAGAARAAVVLGEGFNNIATLTGWQLINRSTPAGQPWFQGNAGVFNAASGPADSYIAANYLSAGGGAGTIDNWLILPALALNGPTSVTFATRSADAPAAFNDTLSVYYSPSGRPDAADFTMLLATVGGASPYPKAWTTVEADINAMGSGRFAFRYTGDAAAANFIGIDDVTVIGPALALPEPASLAQMALGLLAIGLSRRKPR